LLTVIFVLAFLIPSSSGGGPNVVRSHGAAANINDDLKMMTGIANFLVGGKSGM